MAEMGRPSKLTDALIDMAESYAMGGYAEAGDIVPSVAGLACYLGISKQSIYNYAEKNSEIFDTLRRIESTQERLLISGGLSQAFGGVITKLMLTNHGYSDKVNTDITTNGETINKPTRIELVAPNVNSED